MAGEALLPSRNLVATIRNDCSGPYALALEQVKGDLACRPPPHPYLATPHRLTLTAVAATQRKGPSPEFPARSTR
jgi:hypothetical protein